MTGLTRYTINQSHEADVLAHLAECDECFIPRLSERVTLGEYARKIALQASRFEAWCDNGMVGLVAVYFNDPTRKRAFISNVSVLPSMQKKGIARNLMHAVINHACEMRFKELSLEVGSASRAAVHLYKNCGFKIIKDIDDRLFMILKLKGRL